jgi:hypothetical protein
MYQGMSSEEGGERRKITRYIQDIYNEARFLKTLRRRGK